MFARAFRTLILISFTLAAVAPYARAEEGKKPDFAAAKKAFKAGQAFIQMEKYAEAVVEFKKAHTITKDDLVMGQVATAYAKGGDYEAALASIKVYRVALPEEERGTADDFIKQYEAKIKAGESKKLVLSTDKPAETDEGKGEETSDETTPADGDEEEVGRKGRFYTWIAAGAAGALALSALIVGLNAQSKYDELDGECAPKCDPADVDSVKTRAVVTDVLWGTAAVAAVAAGVLWWLEGRNLSDDDEKRGPVEGEDDDSDDDLVKRFRIAPIVGGGTFGLGADIRF